MGAVKLGCKKNKTDRSDQLWPACDGCECTKSDAAFAIIISVQCVYPEPAAIFALSTYEQTQSRRSGAGRRRARLRVSQQRRTLPPHSTASLHRPTTGGNQRVVAPWIEAQELEGLILKTSDADDDGDLLFFFSNKSIYLSTR